MAMNAVLKVDLRIVNSKLGSFRTKRQSLYSLMEALKKTMTALATIAWISPASRMLLQKFLKLYRQIEEAFRIVDEYIHDLEVVMEQYQQVEKRLSDKAESLKTDIFGV